MIMNGHFRGFVAATLFAAVMAVGAAGLCADNAERIRDFEKLKNPKVGQWVFYEMRDAATGAKLTLRQSIVGKETVDGKDAYWLETEVMPRRGNRSVTKMLVRENPSDPANVLKIIEQIGTAPPREVPVPKPDERVEKDRRAKAKKTRIEEVGKETFNTKAGPVETRHFRLKSPDGSTEIWTSDKVGLSGVVRKMGPSGDMILVAYGKIGAKSVISEPRNRPVVREKPGDESGTAGKE